MLEEMENIKYGNLETAMEYCKRNRTEEWIQQFLRCDGHNVALADGLLIEERFYTGIVQFDITLLHNIKEGAPEYLSKKDDMDYYEKYLLNATKEERDCYIKEHPDFMNEYPVSYEHRELLQDKIYRGLMRKIRDYEKSKQERRC